MIKILDINNLEEVNFVKKYLEHFRQSEYLQSIEWFNVRDEKKFYLYSIMGKSIIWTCSVFEKTIEDTKILVANRGPILDFYNASNLKCFVDEIALWIKNQGYQTLVINPNISKETLKNFPQYSNIKFTEDLKINTMFESPKLALMDIDDSEENIFKKISARTRRGIRKSLKFKLKLNITQKLDINSFYKLYLETANRHGFKAHEKTYFERLLNNFKNIVCFEVWNEDTPLAMSINLYYDDKLIYVYGASSSKHRECAAMYFLHWEAIKYAIAKDIPVYDFGGVFCLEDEVDSKDYGLYTFKKNFCYNGFTDIASDIYISSVGG